MSKLLEVAIHNVLGVKDISLDFRGHHLFWVGGKNYQGKSSLLSALMMCVCGPKNMQGYPEVALRNGKKRGSVECVIEGDAEVFGIDNIGPLVLELTWSRRSNGTIKEKFRIYDQETGENSPTPRSLLERMFAMKALDPTTFINMEPKAQATLVQSFLGIDMEGFAKREKKLSEERTICGREGKRIAGHFESLEKPAKDIPEKEVVVTELLEKIDALEEEGSVREDKVSEIETSKRYLEEVEQESEKTIQEIKRLMDKKRDLIRQAEELKGHLENQEAELESIPDHSDEIVDLRQQIKNAEETNRKVRAKVEYDKAKKATDGKRSEYVSLSEKIQKVREERTEAIENAEWPVEGMDFAEDGLLLNGLPLGQASTSQQMIAATQIGMALNPKLRLLILRRGSELDLETMSELEKLAIERDFQIIVEVVTKTDEDEERCTVVIHEGRVKGDDGFDDDDDTQENLNDG